VQVYVGEFSFVERVDMSQMKQPLFFCNAKTLNARAK